ncbi:MAG TPA: glycoside hydrolase family 95 protein, partial [Verrucomicrobiae bacterium]|nr:glycoside hydrolase family 95 protein [Verrucomicrobiae bacterium]
MTTKFKPIRAFWAIVLATSFSATALLGAQTETDLLLWYDKPATKWVEALPVGNGRISAMVFGGIGEERLQLNEGTLWAGGPYDPVNPQAKEALPQVRQLVNEAKYREAAQLLSARVMAKPLGQMPYQTVGSLFLTFANGTNATAYRRELNLDTATTTTSFTSDGVRFSREVFANAPENVIVLRLTADQPKKISFTAGIRTPMRGAAITNEGSDTLVINGKGGDAGGVKGQLTYQARVKIIAKGGKVSGDSGKITVTGANEVTLLIAAATSYKRFDDVSGDPEAIATKTLASAGKKSFARLRDTHLKDYQPLFRRVSLDLGHSDAMKLTTDERIKRFAQGDDAQLAALYYQFARYLLISCSRP